MTNDKMFVTRCYVKGQRGTQGAERHARGREAHTTAQETYTTCKDCIQLLQRICEKV